MIDGIAFLLFAVSHGLTNIVGIDNSWHVGFVAALVHDFGSRSWSWLRVAKNAYRLGNVLATATAILSICGIGDYEIAFILGRTYWIHFEGSTATSLSNIVLFC